MSTPEDQTQIPPVEVPTPVLHDTPVSTPVPEPTPEPVPAPETPVTPPTVRGNVYTTGNHVFDVEDITNIVFTGTQVLTLNAGSALKLNGDAIVAIVPRSEEHRFHILPS